MKDKRLLTCTEDMIFHGRSWVAIKVYLAETMLNSGYINTKREYIDILNWDIDDFDVKKKFLTDGE